MYICIHVYIYIYIHICVYTHTRLSILTPGEDPPQKRQSLERATEQSEDPWEDATERPSENASQIHNYFSEASISAVICVAPS